MSQQGALQESVRAVTGTTLDFNGDLMTLFEQNAGGGVTWDEMALRYFRGLTGAQGVSEALNRFARNAGAYNWSSLGATDWPAYSGDFMEPPQQTRTDFTRASIATAIGEAAEQLSYTADQPRWDSRGAKRGFLVEESRINEARSPDLSGASVGIVGSGGALPTGWVNVGAGGIFEFEVLQIGTEDGFNYFDLQTAGFNNSGDVQTPIIMFMGSTDVVTAVNDYWAAGLTIKTLSEPSHDTWLRIEERTVGGGFLSVIAQSSPIVNTARQRVETTGQATDASAARVNSRLTAEIPDGEMYNSTYRIYVPQLEQARFVTSNIVAPGGPNTRAVESLDISGTDFDFWNAATGTAFWQGSLLGLSAAAATPRVLHIRNALGNSAYSFFYNTAANDGVIQVAITSGGASQISTTGATVEPGELLNIAFSYETGRVSVAMNGIVYVADQAVTLPADIDRMAFFSDGLAGTSSGNGHSFGFGYWKQRKSDTELQAMTVV